MNNHLSNNRGFTLAEMLIVLVSFGAVVACTVPAFVHYNDSHQLRTATETLVGQIRLARTVALSTGVDQPITFETDAQGAMYHVDNPDNSVKMSGRLPSNVMYDASTTRTLTMQSNGRVDHSGMVVLCDRNGKCDTVSVERSGFVISR